VVVQEAYTVLYLTGNAFQILYILYVYIYIYTLYIRAISKVCVCRHTPELTEDSYAQKPANTGCLFYPTISSLPCRCSSTPLVTLDWSGLR